MSDLKAPNQFNVRTAPTPQAGMESYVIVATAKRGICKIMGVGADLTVDDLGTKLQSDFRKQRNALKAKYCNSRDVDLLQSESIWKLPDEWMIALVEQERDLVSSWSAANGSRLPADIASVTLVARATSPSVGFLLVLYEFPWTAACLQELGSAGSSRP